MKNHNLVIAIGIIICFFILFADIRDKGHIMLSNEKELKILRSFRDSTILANDSFFHLKDSLENDNLNLRAEIGKYELSLSLLKIAYPVQALYFEKIIKKQ